MMTWWGLFKLSVASVAIGLFLGAGAWRRYRIAVEQARYEELRRIAAEFRRDHPDAPIFRKP